MVVGLAISNELRGAAGLRADPPLLQVDLPYLRAFESRRVELGAGDSEVREVALPGPSVGGCGGQRKLSSEAMTAR